MSDKDQCRSQFEQWVRSLKLDLECATYEGHALYVIPSVNAAWTTWQAAWAHHSAALAAKDAEIARLRSALEEYGQHEDSCGKWIKNWQHKCDCGLDDALSQPSAQEGPQ